MKKIFTFMLFVAASLSMMGADIVVTTVADGTVDTDGEVPAGSFRAAVSQAQSGDIIKFNATDGDAIALKATISFAGAGKVLVVDGLNSATGKPIILTKAETAAADMRLINIANSGGSVGLDVTLKNFSFENVITSANGAVISSGNSVYGSTAGDPTDFNVTLENCQFKNNEGKLPSANTGGGGVYFVSHGTNLVIKNCLFVGNKQTFTDSEAVDRSKASGGGVISSTGNNTAKIVIINSTFANNSAMSRGGSVFTGHPADLINCTFVGNSAAQGGGFYFHNSNSHNIINCIFTNNHSKLTSESYVAQADLSNGGTGTINISYSLIGETNVAGANNYQAGQPLFAAYEISSYGSIDVPVLANNGGLFPTAALREDGKASGKGTTSVAGFDIPTTDQRGATRLTPPSMGAYEYGGILTNIQEVQTSTAAVTMSVAAGQIVIAAENQGIARVYSLSGAQVAQTAVNGTATVALPKGVYIVKFVETAGSASGIAKVLLK